MTDPGAQGQRTLAPEWTPAAQLTGAGPADGGNGAGGLDKAQLVWWGWRVKLGRVNAEEGRMSDPNSMLATLAVAVVVVSSATLVLSRIIPDEYDRRVLVRRRVDPAAGRRRR